MVIFIIILTTLTLIYAMGYTVGISRAKRTIKLANDDCRSLIKSFDGSQANFKREYEHHSEDIQKAEDLLKRIEEYIEDECAIPDKELMDAIRYARKQYRKVVEMRFLFKSKLFSEEKLNINYYDKEK